MEAAQGGPTETLAAYMAKFYRAKRGYRMGTVPEANALVSACDYILTRPDAHRVLDPVHRRPRGRSRPDIHAVAHCGRGDRQGVPALYRPLRAHPDADAHRDRGDRRGADQRRAEAPPRGLQALLFFSKAVIIAKAIDTASQSIWTNAPLGGPLRGPGLRKMAFGPRLSPAELRPADVVYNPGQGVQVVTYGLLTRPHAWSSRWSRRRGWVPSPAGWTRASTPWWRSAD